VRRIGLSIAGLFVAAACAGSPSAPPTPPSAVEGVLFPRHLLTEEGPAALLEARLVLDSGCLWLQPEGQERNLAVWPSAYELARSDAGDLLVLDGGRRVAASVGQAVRAGGGEYKDLAFIERIVLEPLPAQCAGPVWLVTELLPRS
jgi:hypothetical protein